MYMQLRLYHYIGISVYISIYIYIHIYIEMPASATGSMQLDILNLYFVEALRAGQCRARDQRRSPQISGFRDRAGRCEEE